MAEKKEATKAQMLASLVQGRASAEFAAATIQRSHRFPVWILYQIENMSRMGNMPMSMAINELLELGLEALKKELPQEVIDELTLASEAQVKRPTVTDRGEVKRRQGDGKSKLSRTK